MPNKVLKISDYSLKSSDSFFFDNNIWMYLFCPLGNFQKDKRQKLYSNLLSNILSRNLHIYTNALILSEFSNRYLKLDFDLVRFDPSNAGVFSDYKKSYVNSSRFQQTTKEVKVNLNKIIQICQRNSDEFNSIDIQSVFNLFSTIGFNDSYYLHLAQKKNWIIVSDDSDLYSKETMDINVTILTV